MVLKMEFDTEVEQKFRELAMRRYGFSKGSLKMAGQEAIQRWIKEEEKTLPRIKDPFKLLRGCMKHLRGKYTSVELQHEAINLWTEKD